ncbi:MAG: hypothetical protein KJP10_06530 [Gammaproteobacteria bacterium]|nr:hypothetical protein [Gammaproteobacteria bacterium]
MSNLSLTRPFLPLVIISALMSACGEYAAKGAGSGATTGAVSGAVGGLVSALVFGGDPAEAAARGAVYGGAVGATAGAMGGAQVDKKIEQQREASAEALRSRIGDDAYDGLEALADCKHDVSLKQAELARQSENPNFSLAGLWLEVLSYADQGNEAKARELYPEIVTKDWDISSEAEAEAGMRETLNKLMDIREQYNMPRVCPA